MKKVRLFLAFAAMIAMMTMNAQEIGADELLKIYGKAKQEQKAQIEKDLIKTAKEVGASNDKAAKEALSQMLIGFIDGKDNPRCDEFVISLFKYFGTVNDIDRLNKYVDKERYPDAAIRALAEIQPYANHIIKIVEINNGDLPHKDAYAYAIGRLKITELEGLLHSWLKGADDNLKMEIYSAFMRMGNDESMMLAEKGAKKLFKKKDPKLKIGSMRILAAMEHEKAMPYFYKALKNKDMNVRRTALELMKPYATPEITATVVKKYAKKDAIADIVWWIGELLDKTQADFVIAQLSSQDPRAVEEAIHAVIKMDNNEGMEIVKTMFGGKYQPVIKAALIETTTDNASFLKDVMKGDDNKKLCVLDILKEKRCVALYYNVVNAMNSNNPAVKDAAYKALKNVVTVTHADFLKTTLATCDEKYVADVQEAIKMAMSKASDKQKDTFVQTMKEVQPQAMPRFYKIFAYFKTETSIDKLVECYHSGIAKDKALEAVLLIDNKDFASVVKSLADENDEYSEQLKKHYNKLSKSKK